VLELFNKTEEAKQYIKKKHISEVIIEDINTETANKYNLTNINVIKIKNKDGIGDVFITIKLK